MAKRFFFRLSNKIKGWRERLLEGQKKERLVERERDNNEDMALWRHLLFTSLFEITDNKHLLTKMAVKSTSETTEWCRYSNIYVKQDKKDYKICILNMVLNTFC